MAAMMIDDAVLAIPSTGSTSTRNGLFIYPRSSKIMSGWEFTPPTWDPFLLNVIFLHKQPNHVCDFAMWCLCCETNKHHIFYFLFPHTGILYINSSVSFKQCSCATPSRLTTSVGKQQQPRIISIKEMPAPWGLWLDEGGGMGEHWGATCPATRGTTSLLS